MIAIGVVFRPQSPPEDLRDVVRAADDAGIDELWLWEDCFLEGGLTTAAAALAWSGRLHVGIGLLPVPLRNPAVVAMEVASLARLFPGRFLPGVGHGVQDWMGQVGARVGSPLTLLREHATAVRALLHGERVTVAGRYVHLDGVALDWAPAVVPPVLVGARGPRTLVVSAEVGDGTIVDAGATLHEVADARAVLDEARAAAGREGRQRLVVFAEVTTPAAAVELVAAYEAAGADVVAFQVPAGAPDPRSLIEALATR